MTTNRRSRLAPWVPAVAVAIGFGMTARADYVSTSVSLGGYLLDSKDAAREGEPRDGNLYQTGRVLAAARKGETEARIAYSYSDFHEKRPNTYRNSHRLSMATVSYAPTGTGIQVTAGRDFLILPERSVYFDGGAVAWSHEEYLRTEVFGGYSTPTVFENKMADFSSERMLMGGRVTYSPLPGAIVQADVLKHGEEDGGSAGLTAAGNIHERVRLTGNAVYRVDTGAVTHAEIGGGLRVRSNDEIRLRLGADDDRVDSTRYYHYYVQRAHQYAYGGYSLYFNREARLEADYGIILFDGFTGHVVELKGLWREWFLGASREFETGTNSLNLRAGYEALFEGRYRLAASAGWSRYDLSEDKQGRTALDISVRPGLILGKGLEIGAEYEFLNNSMYEQDHRFFAGIRHTFHRGLGR